MRVGESLCDKSVVQIMKVWKYTSIVGRHELSATDDSLTVPLYNIDSKLMPVFPPRSSKCLNTWSPIILFCFSPYPISDWPRKSDVIQADKKESGE